MTYTKQPHCITNFVEKRNTEKPNEKLNPQTNLIDSLERLYNELHDFSEEPPLENEILMAITQETENAYEKLNTLLDNFKKTEVYNTKKYGRIK